MQVLKEDVRNTIINAALVSFSSRGFSSTSMAEIAKAAGISTGNIYRYFSSKEELFEAAIPQDFVDNVRRILMNVLVLAAGINEVIRPTPQNQAQQMEAKALLLHSIENRNRLIVMLDQARGTPLEGFREETLRLFMSHAIKYAKSMKPSVKIKAGQKVVLRLVYSSFLSNICEILRTSGKPTETFQLLQLYRTYHLAGLKRFLGSDSKLEETI